MRRRKPTTGPAPSRGTLIDVRPIDASFDSSAAARPGAQRLAARGVPRLGARRALSFGGPAGQIAVMHRILVEEKRWISESRFLHALNYCMLLPGPEAQQLATYIGWLMHGTRGGILAGGLFILPGVVAIMALSWIYALYGNVGIVAGAVLRPEGGGARHRARSRVRIGRRALKSNAAGRHRRDRLRRDLRLPRALPADRSWRRADGLRRQAVPGGAPSASAADRALADVSRADGAGRCDEPSTTVRNRHAARCRHLARRSGSLPVVLLLVLPRPRQRLQPDRDLLLARWRW